MYAKLVVGSTALIAHQAMRDIARLIVSSSPSLSLLGAFDAVNSIIVDNTASGWSYVGSTSSQDRPTIASVGTGVTYTNDTNFNFAFSAPCLEGSALKYAILTLTWRNAATNTNRLFQLTGAESVDSLGVATNEGPRYTYNAAATSTVGTYNSIRVAAGDIIHLIANPRHITIINEGRGISSIFETTMTDVHRFYNEAPVIQYCHCDTSNLARGTNIIPVIASTATTGAFMGAAFAVNNVSNGTFFGTLDITSGGTRNTGSYFHNAADFRQTTITTNGMPKYQVSPLSFQIGWLGYPVQYVTGVVPIYLTAPQIGVSGDSVDINGDTYTFFNAGAGFGVAMQY
jgi:hypothetical protein